MKTISVHHESVAGFMADVYYRVSGQPIATFTSCGPGSANLPISLGNAVLDSVPFMAVTGNVPTSTVRPAAPFRATPVSALAPSATYRDVPGCSWQAPLHRAGATVSSSRKAVEGQKAKQPVRHRRNWKAPGSGEMDWHIRHHHHRRQRPGTPTSMTACRSFLATDDYTRLAGRGAGPA